MENCAIVAMQSRMVSQEVSDAVSSVPETQWKFVVTRTKLVFIEVGIQYVALEVLNTTSAHYGI